jgi:archaemetzincin
MSFVLIAFGHVDPRWLHDLCTQVTLRLKWPGEVSASTLRIPLRAYHLLRRQYRSSQLLNRIRHFIRQQDLQSHTVIGVTDVDLYAPSRTFVFGEAEHPGSAAIVSVYRLRQDADGRDVSPSRLFERAMKEVIHELGHTQGLSHCPDARCVMASSITSRDIDRKNASLCSQCAVHLPTSPRV